MRPEEQQARTVRDVGALVAVLVFNFALRWPFRHAPLIRDEGEYAHLGLEIAAGAVPYLDVYNQKTPLVFYLFAGIQRWLGESVEVLRLATTLWGSAAAICVFLLTRRLVGPAAAVWSVVAFCVMTFDQCGIIHQSSSEFFLLLWIAAGAYFWVRSAESGGGLMFAVLAGVCAGLGYQTKQSGLFLLLFFTVEAAWTAAWGRRSGGTPSGSFERVAVAWAGALTVLLVTVLLFAANGALAQYVECTWTNNLQYVGSRHGDLARLLLLVSEVVRNVVRWDVGLWALGVVALGQMAVSHRGRAAGGTWILLAGAATMALTAGNAYVHYYEPLIVPLAVGVGAGCAWLWRRARSAATPGWRIAGFAVLALPWLLPAAHGVEILSHPRAALANRVARLPPVGLDREAASYLASQTSPEERILVVGSEPQIYYYARRRASQPMAFTYPLTGPYDFAEAKRRAFLDHLRDRGPRYVVMVLAPTSLSEWGGAARAFARSASSILRDRYVADASFADSADPARPPGLVVFRRKGESVGWPE